MSDNEETILNPPCEFGRFIVERELGHGGMGGVFLARDKMLDRQVALKVMLKSLGEDPQFLERFKREAQAAARLIHPAIAQIYSYDIVDGQPYIAMEMAGGGSLLRLMEVHGKNIDPTRVMRVCKQVAEGLSCAADQGLVHGDIKPENILFDATGAAKIVDFGLAGMQDDNSGDEIWGTPYYIAPEKVRKGAETRENRMVCSYAFAVSEQNAMGETIVTAPTCGASGVLPAVLYYQQQKNRVSDERIIHALETAGLVGNLIKTNASISGAECGCQAEIGSACAMAAVALGELFELSIDKIEYAAEICIEHHLGLTCDPICGLVQIPCIERNAVAAMRAINAVSLASFLWGSRKISFDKVVHTMKETGRDLSSSYKETSEAGLAKLKIK